MRRVAFLTAIAAMACSDKGRGDDNTSVGSVSETDGMCEDNGTEDCPCIDGQLCVAGLVCVDDLCQSGIGDDSGTDGDDGKPPLDLPSGDGDGDGDGDGTCEGACGGISGDGSCYCDPACTANDDCCSDYESACPGQCGSNDDCAADEVCSAGSFSCVEAYGHSYSVVVTQWCDLADVYWDIDDPYADVYYQVVVAGDLRFTSSTEDNATCTSWSEATSVVIEDDEVFYVQFWDEDALSDNQTNYWCEKNGADQCWAVSESTLHDGVVSECVVGAGEGCYDVEIRFTAD